MIQINKNKLRYFQGKCCDCGAEFICNSKNYIYKTDFRYYTDCTICDGTVELDEISYYKYHILKKVAENENN